MKISATVQLTVGPSMDLGSRMPLSLPILISRDVAVGGSIDRYFFMEVESAVYFLFYISDSILQSAFYYSSLPVFSIRHSTVNDIIPTLPTIYGTRSSSPLSSGEDNLIDTRVLISKEL